MTAKEYLSRYGEISREILALLDERQKLEDMLLRLSPNLNANRVQGGPLPTPGAAIEKLVDLDSVIAAQVEQLKQTRRAISERINAMENPRHRMILQFKYLDNLSNTRIADRTGYDERHVRRLHKAALEALGDLNL